MTIAKLLPTIVVFGLILAIITSTFWGRWLRSYREITQKASEFSDTNANCGGGSRCIFGGEGLTLREFSTRENIGAKISLVYCVSQRMTDCFGEWSHDVLKRLFPRVITTLIVFIIAYLITDALAPYFTALQAITNVDAGTTMFVGLSSIFSLTEIYTSIELMGRYKELAATGKALIGDAS
jgi:hypothetical protein